MNKTQISQIVGSRPVLRHLCGDGSELLPYNACVTDVYFALRSAYEADGYTLYCEEPSNPIRSATYVKGDEYAVLFLFSWEKQLHVTISKKGAKSLPAPTPDGSFAPVCPVTLTQPRTEQQGMCEIFRLSDGSFLIFDSSNRGAEDALYRTLCDLNGSPENIRIRAWVFTHTHGDHYGGFLGFAPKYASSVTLDTVMYAPVNRDVIATIASYKTSWDTIDYFFNGGLADFVGQYFPSAALCTVHAGEKFRLPGVDLRILYTPEHLYIDRIPINMNHGSIVAQVVAADGKALIMGDSEHCSTYWLVKTYQETLQSDIFQYPHHGGGRVPDPVTTVLTRSRAVVIPCTSDYYKRCSNAYTKMVENWEWTEATYIMGDGTVTLQMSGRPAIRPV